jgi:hypothetical protein
MPILLFPLLDLLYLASLANLNSFLSKHKLMTNSQKTKNKENVAPSDDSCCDDSCCGGSSGRPSVSLEGEVKRGGACC